MAKFEELIARRAKHEPVAYLIKNKEFYGRNFYVDKRVHIPKPATEDLIDAVLRVIARSDAAIPYSEPFTIADIGTGSGCIAITLALELQTAKIIATDISSDALDVARHNADILGASDRITFLKGNLLPPLTEKSDIIIANLPYGWHVSPHLLRGRLRGGSSEEIWTTDKEVFFQPRASYDGGHQGLELIRQLIFDLAHHLKDQGQCFIEFDPRQTEKITQLAKDNNFDISIKKDTSGFDRIAILTKIQNQS